MGFLKGEHNYCVELEVRECKNGEILTTWNKTSIDFDGYVELDDIVTFQNELSDIFKKVRKASKKGLYINLEITAAIYDYNNCYLSSKYYDRWSFSGINQDTEGIHITADTKYTPVYKDAYIYFNSRTLFADFANLVKHSNKDL